MPGHWTDSPATWPMWDGSAPPADTLRHRARILAAVIREAEFQAPCEPKSATAWVTQAQRWSDGIDEIEAVLRNAAEQETIDA